MEITVQGISKLPHFMQTVARQMAVAPTTRLDAEDVWDHEFGEGVWVGLRFIAWETDKDGAFMVCDIREAKIDRAVVDEFFRVATGEDIPSSCASWRKCTFWPKVGK